MNISLLTDRKVRLPRIWSNRELEKFSHLFKGNVVNVSGWKDIDKEGKHYKDYFSKASSYSITNFSTDKKGFQHEMENQIFLDLEAELSSELKEKFDVVFNHTVLEHVFECEHAFTTLCEMSSDIVIIVVPFLQHQHSAYGDYWRFTPEGISRLFEKNKVELQYISYNNGSNQAIYVFAIGSKKPEKWRIISDHPDNKIATLTEKVGHDIVSQTLLYKARELMIKILVKIKSVAKTIIG